MWEGFFHSWCHCWAEYPRPKQNLSRLDWLKPRSVEFRTSDWMKNLKYAEKTHSKVLEVSLWTSYAILLLSSLSMTHFNLSASSMWICFSQSGHQKLQQYYFLRQTQHSNEQISENKSQNIILCHTCSSQGHFPSAGRSLGFKFILILLRLNWKLPTSKKMSEPQNHDVGLSQWSRLLDWAWQSCS